MHTIILVTTREHSKSYLHNIFYLQNNSRENIELNLIFITHFIHCIDDDR